MADYMTRSAPYVRTSSGDVIISLVQARRERERKKEIEKQRKGIRPLGHVVLQRTSLNEEGRWDDGVKGDMSYSVVENGETIRLIVRAEDDDEIILDHRVDPSIYYEREGDSIIIWNEEEEFDRALSFQDINRLNEVWEQIYSVVLRAASKDLYEAAQNAIPLLNRQQEVHKQLEELAGRISIQWYPDVMKILNKFPDDVTVTSTMREINDAIRELNNANDKYSRRSAMNEQQKAITEIYTMGQGGGKQGGYKVLRDTVARTEVRSRTPSSLNRRNITKTKRTKTRRQKTRTPIKKILNTDIDTLH
jgi:hypothetical protein